MRQYRRGSHSVYQCHYHFVFIPKYRKPVLRGEIGSRLRELVREICRANDIEILQGHVRPDHVHLLLSVLYRRSHRAGSCTRSKGRPRIDSCGTSGRRRFQGDGVIGCSAGEPSGDFSREANASETTVEFRCTVDPWPRALLLTLAQRYGLKPPYRYRCQRDTALMLRGPEQFIREVFAPEYRQMLELLQDHLASVTEPVVAEALEGTAREPTLVDAEPPRALSAGGFSPN